MKICKKLFTFIFFLNVVAITSSVAAKPHEKEVLTAMRKAADFMANTVSNRGGYVYLYSEDLSKQWGEIPARSTQIWIQPPGTPAVGMMYLDVYEASGNPVYLNYAKKAAHAYGANILPEDGTT